MGRASGTSLLMMSATATVANARMCVSFMVGECLWRS